MAKHTLRDASVQLAVSVNVKLTSWSHYMDLCTNHTLAAYSACHVHVIRVVTDAGVHLVLSSRLSVTHVMIHVVSLTPRLCSL